MELRKNKIKGDILILGYTRPDQFPLLCRYHLIQTVVDYSYAQLLNQYGKKMRVHVGIDTGMHRLGERFENLEELCEIFGMKNLIIEGAYTHLSTSDSTSVEDQEYVAMQAEAFYRTMDELKARGLTCPKIHLQASYGLLNYPQYSGNYVRAGIALYGVLSTQEDLEACKQPLLPVLSLKVRVAAVKNLYRGEGAGYDLGFVAPSPMKIAVLTIGYADGLPRSLSYGKGRVLINGFKARIIGRICMDQTLVDITGAGNVQAGDVAVVIGKSRGIEITAGEMAKQGNTITNEILSRLGERLERYVISS